MDNQGTAGDGQLSITDGAFLLKAKIRTNITRVMATYLTLLEDVSEEHDESMGKLVDALAPDQKQFAILADHFGDARFEAIRRHVLKAGNDSIRELEGMIDALQIR